MLYKKTEKVLKKLKELNSKVELSTLKKEFGENVTNDLNCLLDYKYVSDESAVVKEYLDGRAMNNYKYLYKISVGGLGYLEGKHRGTIIQGVVIGIGILTLLTTLLFGFLNYFH